MNEILKQVSEVVNSLESKPENTPIDGLYHYDVRLSDKEVQVSVWIKRPPETQKTTGGNQ